MAIVTDIHPTTKHKAQEMSLDEFMKSAGTAEVKELSNLMSRFNGGTYMACHVRFYEATGVWIKELVPVFQKMDAMVALGEPVRPQELT